MPHLPVKLIDDDNDRELCEEDYTRYEDCLGNCTPARFETSGSEISDGGPTMCAQSGLRPMRPGWAHIVDGTTISSIRAQMALAATLTAPRTEMLCVSGSTCGLAEGGAQAPQKVSYYRIIDSKFVRYQLRCNAVNRKL
jgi:hypothetical protein